MEACQVPCMNEGGVETTSGIYSKPHLATIEVHQVLCMNGGEGETSYANNSLLQKKVMLKAKPILQESMVELYCTSFPECIKVADMGCSSGPNTFMPIWEIIEIIDTTCRNLNRKPPMLQVFLNDLPGNDFNTIFKSLPSFYKKLEKEKGCEFGPCFITGMPGSFYGRLFPDHTLHFVYSSYSLHWRSQVPEGLMSETGIQLNKGSIYIAKTSPPGVQKAYLDQFERDFTAFLRSRSEEMIPGGRMVLAFMGCNESDDSSEESGSINIWELFGMILHDMVIEGLIEESKLDSFNMPFYAPSAEEVRHVIQAEGSFIIHRLETFKLNWDANIDDGNKYMVFDKYSRAKFVAKRMRAVGESILASHFGDALMDCLFHRFTVKVADYLEMGTGVYTNLVISLAI